MICPNQIVSTNSFFFFTLNHIIQDAKQNTHFLFDVQHNISSTFGIQKTERKLKAGNPGDWVKELNRMPILSPKKSQQSCFISMMVTLYCQTST